MNDESNSCCVCRESSPGWPESMDWTMFDIGKLEPIICPLCPKLLVELGIVREVVRIRRRA